MSHPLAYLGWLRKAKAFCTQQKDRNREERKAMRDGSVFVKFSDEVDSWPECSENRYQYGEYTVSYIPPSFYDTAEWIYLVDLDDMVFTINETIHIKLDSIPRGEDNEEWFIFIAADTLHNFCPNPYLSTHHRRSIYRPMAAPYCAVNGLPLDNNNFVPRTIPPETWALDSIPHLKAARKLAMVACDGFISGAYGIFHRTRQENGRQRDYGNLRERLTVLAELLQAAAPFFSQFKLVPAKHLERFASSRSYGFTSLPHRWSYEESQPQSAFLWFRGCLIYLNEQFTKESKNKSIAAVVSYLRDKDHRNTTAIICSGHYVMAVVLSDGEVSSSEVYPLVAGYGSEEEEVGYQEALLLLSYYLLPSNLISDERVSGSLPFDVILRVLDFMTDEKTIKKFTRVCQALRLPAMSHLYMRAANYRILGCSDVENGFFATDTDDERLEVIFSPTRCRGRIQDRSDLYECNEPNRYNPAECLFFYREVESSDYSNLRSILYELRIKS